MSTSVFSEMDIARGTRPPGTKRREVYVKGGKAAAGRVVNVPGFNDLQRF